MNNKQVALTLASRVSAQNSSKSLFGNDQNGYFTVFSYDLHFPLAVWDGDTWLLNEDSTTRTTSRHRTLMRVALIGQPTFPSDTATLRRLLRL